MESDDLSDKQRLERFILDDAQLYEERVAVLYDTYYRISKSIKA